MALHQLTSIPATTFSRLPPTNYRISIASFSRNVVFPSGVQCKASIKMCDETIVRRSANYQPSIWGFDYIQSLKSEYVGESCAKRVKQLKKDVRLMLDTVVDPLHQLELVDDLQRLGISYHFENEIKSILNSIYNKNPKQESLYTVALKFRLLRQHGYDIPAEIFNNFRDEKQNFKSCLNDDCKQILSLYEAAFLLKEGENAIFHDIRSFTTSYLKAYVTDNKDQYLSTLVSHALELPLNWSMLRLEARWFMDVYKRRPDMSGIVLELAKLDYNMVQATHQDDLKYSSRWWKNTGLGEKLSFARDRLMENFLWTVGVIFEPEFGYCRRMSTKVNALITTIDDVYDVYGHLECKNLAADSLGLPWTEDY
ncbi:hypothetical protein Pint_11399 [Pistacia integerrima]|uniref:Uncharacterized protein n=1 Tax=Pistacia integerrima TaxID=434235 RepID=A0ACC0XJR6_9ROSI|nr:hypothetical protein Pint_11399 [Pistacia integerrima]